MADRLCAAYVDTHIFLGGCVKTMGTCATYEAEGAPSYSLNIYLPDDRTATYLTLLRRPILPHPTLVPLAEHAPAALAGAPPGISQIL